jgi:hypothetical protein
MARALQGKVRRRADAMNAKADLALSDGPAPRLAREASAQR